MVDQVMVEGALDQFHRHIRASRTTATIRPPATLPPAPPPNRKCAPPVAPSLLSGTRPISPSARRHRLLLDATETRLASWKAKGAVTSRCACLKPENLANGNHPSN